MAARMPADRPVWTDDPVEAAALVGAEPSEFQIDRWGGAVRKDARWEELEAKLGTGPRGWDVRRAPNFCHERYTPAGDRRLVVVEGMDCVTIVEPGGGLIGRAPRAMASVVCEPDEASVNAIRATHGLAGASRTFAGRPDAADRARWTVPFVDRGVPGAYEYRLGNDDRVTVRMLDPEGFTARAAAAEAAAATRRAP